LHFLSGVEKIPVHVISKDHIFDKVFNPGIRKLTILNAELCQPMDDVITRKNVYRHVHLG